MTKLPTLTEISIEALEIEKQLMETGELSPDLELKHDENKELLAKKIDHYFFAYENMEDKKVRLRNYKKQVDAAIKRLDASQEFLVKKLQIVGESGLNLKGELGAWEERTSTYIEVTDIELLPVDCVRLKTEPDKERIKERMDAGEVVPGATREKRVTLKFRRDLK